MQRTDKLQRAYRTYNRKYFGGTLPRLSEVELKWEQLPQVEAAYQQGNKIAISKKFRHVNAVWRLALLHEMAHIANPKGRPHGRLWQKTMYRLAAAGAFEKLW